MFKSRGRLIYNPILGKEPVVTPWWVILETPQDIVEYYNHWFKKTYGVRLLKPKWGSHISIIRGERPIDQLEWFWGHDNGRLIQFEYTNDFEFNHDYVWIKAWGKDLIKVRENVGLLYKPRWDFHITIGKFPREIYTGFNSLHEVIRER